VAHLQSNMDRLYYNIEGQMAEIYQPIYNSGMYLVTLDQIEMGYLYISYVDEDLEKPIWVASTEFVGTYLDELSKYIESTYSL